MGALVGLGLGIGLVLIGSAFAVPRVERRPAKDRRGGPLAGLLARAGVPGLSPTTFLALCVATGATVALVVWVMTGVVPIAAAFAAIAAGLPVSVLGARARRRQREFAEVWPEAVDNLASGIRAGLSLPDALAGLAVRGPEPLRPAFAGFVLDYQVTGRFGDCLDRLKATLADPVGDRVIESLRIAREVGGGDLGRLLRSLSGFLREELRTRAELESRQSWTVYGARLAVAAPWVVLLVMSLQTEVVHRYSSPAGIAVLAIGGTVCAVAYQLMTRVGRLPTERRILS